MISQKQFWSNIQYNLFFYNIIFIGSEYHNTNINNGTNNHTKTVQRHDLGTFYTSVIYDKNKVFTIMLTCQSLYFQGTSSLLEYLVSSLPIRYFRRTSSSWFFWMFSFLTMYWFRRLLIFFLYLLLLLMFCLASCLLLLISALRSCNWVLNLAFSSFSNFSI